MKKYFFTLVLVTLLLSGCKKNETVFIEDRLILHTDVQRAFISNPPELVNLFARGVEELSRPLKPTFSWDGEVKPYTVYLSEHSDYSDSFVYEVEENKVSFTNLKIDTKYYYKAVSNDEIVKEDSFLTSDEVIRTMYVSGVTNVRDLGGYPTSEGILNQGIIYRTGRISQNSTETPTLKINEKGIHVMLNEMKVKSEIDLRMVSDNEVGGLTEGVGVLGETVKYYQCPMSYSSSMNGDLNDESLRKVFSILGNKDNYPTFFHCSIGTDRTGYVAWLINACLGVEEKNLWRDYLFSNFGNIGSPRTMLHIKDGYVSAIKKCNGKTLKEKATNYLLDKGVKQEEIDVIKQMMLDNK